MRVPRRGSLRGQHLSTYGVSRPDRGEEPLEGRQAPEASPGSSSNWIYRTAAQGTNALRVWSFSAPSSLMASTMMPPALFSTNLASKPRPLPNRTATRCPFHSLGKYPANVPPLSAYDLRASYPYVSPSRPSWAVKRRQACYKLDKDDGRPRRPGRPHGQCCGQDQVVVVALSPRLVGVVAACEVDLYAEV